MDANSRQILTYWTPERMRSAEPEPNIEFTDSTIMYSLSSKAIHDFWTPERLAAAQPEELVYGEHIETEEQAAAYSQVKAAGSLKIVPDSTVKTFPYQSVGKLFYTKVDPSGSKRDSYASAYVAVLTQPHAIKTAAHCLKSGSETSENILFIPGFIPPNTQSFGSYPQIAGGEGVAWFVDSNWNPNNMQAKYDQGTILLDINPSTGKYVDQVVTPIPLLKNQQYTLSTEWNTIGFPQASSQNPDGKMAERRGNFKSMGSSQLSVYKDGTLPGGTSGGPWILTGSNNKSNGIQAGNQSSSAVSTYFH